MRRCPKFDAYMQPHCGYATAVLGSGPLPCRPISFGRDRAALFFQSLERHFGRPSSMPGAAVCQGVAKVSHPRVGMPPHRPKDASSPSLWTSLLGVLCCAQQWLAQRRGPSSGGACHPSEPHVQPTAAVLSWWVPQYLTCWLCAEMRMTLRGHLVVVGYGSVRRDVALSSPPWDEIIRLVNRDPHWHSRSPIHHNPGGKDIRIEISVDISDHATSNKHR